MKIVDAISLGITDCKSTWELQKTVFASRLAGDVGDVLILNEHNHVYTLGKNSSEHHLLATADELRQSGVDVCAIDRGGDITYHGPGQLVGYPILKLDEYYADVHRYLRDIEEVIIRTLADFGISAHRDDGFTGVWVGGDKIAAIGVKVSHWITMHGFALNVNTDLSYFDRIIPCGIFHKGVTSMERVLGERVTMESVARSIVEHFGEVFGCQVRVRDRDQLLERVSRQCERTSSPNAPVGDPERSRGVHEAAPWIPA